MEPYRPVVEQAGASYTGYDRPHYPGSLVKEPVGPEEPLDQIWDAILCNQMLQYVPDVPDLLRQFHGALKRGGALVLTGPTNWPEVEDGDLHRFTIKGIELLLKDAGFRNVDVKSRAVVHMEHNQFSLGYGALAIR